MFWHLHQPALHLRPPCSLRHNSVKISPINNPILASLVAQLVKNLLTVQETQVNQVQSLGWEDPLEKEMATHSSIFAWRIPWIAEPGGSERVGMTEWLTLIMVSNSLGERKSIISLTLSQKLEKIKHRKEGTLNSKDKLKARLPALNRQVVNTKGKIPEGN